MNEISVPRSCILVGVAVALFVGCSRNSKQQDTFGLIPEQVETQSPKPMNSYNWSDGIKVSICYRARMELGNAVHNSNGMTIYHVDSNQVLPSELPANHQSPARSGTAFVIHPDGLLVTCAHVVQGCQSIKLTLNGITHAAHVYLVDEALDLALLRISAKGLPHLRLCDSDHVELAQDIRAIGYPLASESDRGIKVTRGSVTGIVESQVSGKKFQIDASLNPGNSGGPLIDNSGQVIAMATSMVTGEGLTNVGIGLAINELRQCLRQRGIDFLPPPSKSEEKLEGPEIARRVSPAVGLIEVSDSECPHQAKFRMLSYSSTEFSDRGSVLDGLSYLGSIQSRDERSRLAISEFGEIGYFGGERAIPMINQPVGQVGLEALPRNGELQWKRTASYSILRQVVKTPIRDQFSGLSIPPSIRFGLRRPDSYQQTEVQVIPVQEQNEYQVESTSGANVIIKKKHSLTSTSSNTTKYSCAGEGIVIFDTNKRCFTKGDIKYTATLEEKNVALRVPVQLEWHLFESQASQPKLATSPSYFGTPEPSLTNGKELKKKPAASSSGLDQFDPSK